MDGVCTETCQWFGAGDEAGEVDGASLGWIVEGLGRELKVATMGSGAMAVDVSSLPPVVRVLRLVEADASARYLGLECRLSLASSRRSWI
jgi:hypothetical protein